MLQPLQGSQRPVIRLLIPILGVGVHAGVDLSVLQGGGIHQTADTVRLHHPYKLRVRRLRRKGQLQVMPRRVIQRLPLPVVEADVIHPIAVHAHPVVIHMGRNAGRQALLRDLHMVNSVEKFRMVIVLLGGANGRLHRPQRSRNSGICGHQRPVGAVEGPLHIQLTQAGDAMAVEGIFIDAVFIRCAIQRIRAGDDAGNELIGLCPLRRRQHIGDGALPPDLRRGIQLFLAGLRVNDPVFTPGGIQKTFALEQIAVGLGGIILHAGGVQLCHLRGAGQRDALQRGAAAQIIGEHHPRGFRLQIVYMNAGILLQNVGIYPIVGIPVGQSLQILRHGEIPHAGQSAGVAVVRSCRAVVDAPCRYGIGIRAGGSRSGEQAVRHCRGLLHIAAIQSQLGQTGHPIFAVAGDQQSHIPPLRRQRLQRHIKGNSGREIH